MSTLVITRRLCVSIAAVIDVYYAIIEALSIRPVPITNFLLTLFLFLWAVLIGYLGWKAQRIYFWGLTILTAMLAVLYPSPWYIVALPFLIIASLTMIKWAK